MQNRPGNDGPVIIEDPATFAEIAIGDGELDDVDDELALLGAVLLVSGWDPDVELLPVEEGVPERAPDPPPEDGVPVCGADDEDDSDKRPVFSAIVTIRGVQERLAWLGWYHERCTGRIDPATQKALRAFQEAAKLPRNGLPDGATRDALAARIGW